MFPLAIVVCMAMLVAGLIAILAFSVAIGVQARRYRGVRVTAMRADLARKNPDEGVALPARLA